MKHRILLTIVEKWRKLDWVDGHGKLRSKKIGTCLVRLLGISE